jgi:hypothetical protein
MGLAGLAWLGGGCGGPPVEFFQPITPAPGFTEAPGDPATFEELLRFDPDPACQPTVPRTLNARTEIRLFTGDGIPRESAQRFASGLARYFSHYQLSFFIRHDLLPVPLDHAIVLNTHAIEDWIRANTALGTAELSGSDASPALLEALGAAMFYNVKQFLHAYAYPKQNVLNVVLLKRIAALDPTPDEAPMAWGVAGLGLSDEVLNSLEGSDLGGDSLSTMLGEHDFTPTIFIGVLLSDFVLPAPDLVIAHEAGHAFGLEHTSSEKTLMTQGLKDCSASLNNTQLGTIDQNPLAAAALAPLGHLPPARPTLEELSFQHQAGRVLAVALQQLLHRNQR